MAGEKRCKLHVFGDTGKKVGSFAVDAAGFKKATQLARWKSRNRKTWKGETVVRLSCGKATPAEGSSIMSCAVERGKVRCKASSSGMDQLRAVRRAVKENRVAPRVVHGHLLGNKPSPTYRSWKAMIQRTTNRKREDYQFYGGNGIATYFGWVGPGGFEEFLRDLEADGVGLRPDESYSLSRKDHFGDYEPGNVEWKKKSQNSSEAATRRVQK